ncbi:hypothetical protein BBJ28_00004839 [Nothophytophthora sp. Chile5]|nr:hypothetical protein BBJ28_00004839 [Nothophytophthora sp. Chile5]
MATSGSRWQRRSLSLLLAVAALAVCGTILGVKAAVELPAAAAVDTCSAQEMQQFSVVVVSNAPLGLRLNEKLEVLAFLADGEGRSRDVEASGLAEIGDRLVAVNDQSLETFTLEAAVEALRSAASPRILRFQTHDGRCVQPSPASMTTANSTSVFGCPMHQKAAMAEEAGAKGVVFVQRVGEKPLPVRLPPVSELPRAIRIPLAMVSIDSGTQLLEQMSTVRPDETQQLRFVFSAACAADRFSVHPEDGDPLRRSAAFLIDAASAGFLSVSVASSAETELLSDAYEFLKPADYSSAASSSGMNLPLGKHDLYFPDARIFDPCETDPMRISPLVRSRQSQMVDTFAAVRLRDPKGERGCSLMRQLVYLEAKHPAGIILGDPQFPHAASSLAAAVAVQQLKVPVVFISINAFRMIRCVASFTG